jgi:hypothetical protein
VTLFRHYAPKYQITSALYGVDVNRYRLMPKWHQTHFLTHAVPNNGTARGKEHVCTYTHTVRKWNHAPKRTHMREYVLKCDSNRYAYIPTRVCISLLRDARMMVPLNHSRMYQLAGAHERILGMGLAIVKGRYGMLMVLCWTKYSYRNRTIANSNNPLSLNSKKQ